MKFIRYTIFSLLVLWIGSISLIWICFARQGEETSKTEAWRTTTIIEQYSPVKFVDEIYDKANKQHATKVQDTAFDTINSDNTSVSGRSKFTFTNTIVYVVENLHHYLQYVMFAWLALATIFIIINWLKFVTKWEAHMKDFKKNIVYTIIWVWLLVAFYYVIDVFTALANMFLEK